MPVIGSNAQCSDLVSKARLRLNDPSSNGRWSDASMISFANDACHVINRDVLFPQARWDITIVPNQATYQISPVVITTDAVFVNGQLCPRTTKKIMSGQQIGLNDSSSTTLPTATGVEIPGSVTGQYAPAWISAAPAIFPYHGLVKLALVRRGLEDSRRNTIGMAGISVFNLRQPTRARLRCTVCLLCRI